MKKFFILLIVFSISIVSFAQQDSIKLQDGIMLESDSLFLKKGVISKIVDYEITPKLSSIYSKFETCVRKFTWGDECKYYYRIVKSETSSSPKMVEMIEYSDLVAINNSFAKLLSEYEWDTVEKPDYLENRYITDNLKVGYFVEKKLSQWFVQLTRFSGKPYSTGYFKANLIIANFKRAQAKIEELKSIDSYNKTEK